MSDVVVSVYNLVNQFGLQRVHDQLCLEIQRGEIFGIVGGSGSGKTVLLHSILGLRHPQSGDIKVLDQKPMCFQRRPSRDIGVLFQGGALFTALTVRQNVELPIALHSKMPVSTRRKLAELKIRMAGLSVSAADKYPSELSGGMVKRAALARALALEPKILFLDEPTSGLDPVSATDFDQLIEHLKQSLDLTVVMITHDVDTLSQVCDRLAVLVNGKAKVGTVDSFLNDDTPWIQRYFHDPRMARALSGRIRE